MKKILFALCLDIFFLLPNLSLAECTDIGYTSLFVALNLSVLKKKFVLLEKSKTGKEILRPIQMEKAGLFYDITRWYVPKQVVMQK